MKQLQKAVKNLNLQELEEMEDQNDETSQLQQSFGHSIASSNLFLRKNQNNLNIYPHQNFKQIEKKNLPTDRVYNYDEDGNICSYQVNKQKVAQASQISISTKENQTSPLQKNAYNNNKNLIIQGDNDNLNTRKSRLQQNSKVLMSLKRIPSDINFIRQKKLVSQLTKQRKTISPNPKKLSQFNQKVKQKNESTFKQENLMQKLSKKVIDRVGDITYIYQDSQEKKEDKLLNNCFLRSFMSFIDKIPVIQPVSPVKIIFDTWQVFLIVYRIYFLSIKLCFFINKLQDSANLINTNILFIMNISFIFDILLSANTGFYDMGVINNNRSDIFKRYFKKFFLFDFLVQIPLVMTYFNLKNNSKSFLVTTFILEFMILLKVSQIQKYLYHLEIIVSEYEKANLIWPICVLAFQCIMLSHIVALIHYAGAMIQISLWQETETWIQTQGFEDKGWLDLYIHCSYWAFQIMISNPIYDPQTRTEILICILATVGMAGVFAYVLNVVGMVLDNVKAKKKQIQEDRSMINRFMKSKKIPSHLRERVSMYLDYYHKQSAESKKEEDSQVFKILSSQLQKELLQNANQQNISKFSKLLNNFSIQTTKKVVFCIQELLFSPGDIIYAEGDTDQDKTQDASSIYVVIKGQVELFTTENGGQIRPIGVVEKDQMFGNYEFFTGQQRQEGVRALEACTVIKIDRQDFINIIKKNRQNLEITQDYQKFCMIKDQMLEHSYSPYNKFECLICNREGHFSKDCPSTKVSVNKTELIYAYNHFHKQVKRNSHFQRIIDKSLHSLLYNEIIKLEMEEFLENLDEVPDWVLQLQKKDVQDDVSPLPRFNVEEVPIFKNQNSYNVQQSVITENQNKLDIPEQYNQILKINEFMNDSGAYHENQSLNCKSPVISANRRRKSRILQHHIQEQGMQKIQRSKQRQLSINLVNRKRQPTKILPYLQLEKRKEQDDIRAQQQKDYLYMIQNFEKLKNWSNYKLENNFETIMRANKYFKVQDYQMYNSVSSKNLSLQSFFDQRKRENQDFNQNFNSLQGNQSQNESQDICNTLEKKQNSFQVQKLNEFDQPKSAQDKNYFFNNTVLLNQNSKPLTQIRHRMSEFNNTSATLKPNFKGYTGFFSRQRNSSQGTGNKKLTLNRNQSP